MFKCSQVVVEFINGHWSVVVSFVKACKFKKNQKKPQNKQKTEILKIQEDIVFSLTTS